MVVRGNIEGLRKDVLAQLEELDGKVIPKHLLVDKGLAQGLAQLTALINREIAVYIDRHGRIQGVMVGDKSTTPLFWENFRRGEFRLAGIRCIHTHPSGNSQLSSLDMSSLAEFRLDAMAAIGTKEGKVLGVSVAFLSGLKEGYEPYRVYGPLSISELEEFPFWQILMDLDKEFNKPIEEVASKYQEKTLLVGLKKQRGSLLSGEESLAELAELAKTAGAQVVHKVLSSNEKPDSAFYIGKGKVQEIAWLRQNLSLDLVIFDDELSPRQQKNLEDNLGARVIDRTALILQIFADRARTKEGKLQVELAQLNYLLPRLIGFGESMSRLGGGIGTRGPGETKLETDRRRIRKRISDLQKEIEEIKKQRGVLRQQREQSCLPVIALVGYTNAGKSTILNTLTEAEVLAENKLFATLDPTMRRLKLFQGEALLTDTVGFIHKLPHQLVAAFRATLEEIKYADLLLHVVDASHPSYEAHISSVREVLRQIGTEDKPTLVIFNKWDLVTNPQEMVPIVQQYTPSMQISAQTGENIEDLLLMINSHLPLQTQEIKLLIPFSRSALLNSLHQEGEVRKTVYLAEGIYCEALLYEHSLRRFREFIIEKEQV